MNTMLQRKTDKFRSLVTLYIQNVYCITQNIFLLYHDVGYQKVWQKKRNNSTDLSFLNCFFLRLWIHHFYWVVKFYFYYVIIRWKRNVWQKTNTYWWLFLRNIISYFFCGMNIKRTFNVYKTFFKWKLRAFCAIILNNCLFRCPVDLLK